MLRFLVLAILSMSCLPALAIEGEPAIDDLLPLEDETRSVVSLSHSDVAGTGDLDLVESIAFLLGVAQKDTPYLWGGDSWTEGVDCSHFTRKVFRSAGTGYTEYMQTKTLRDLESGNGMVKIDLGEAEPGDLLVYGYFDDEANWQGHVVILVDADFENNGQKGLMLGSHGQVGVQFITVTGFPHFFRYPHITLRNVLRVVR